MSPQDFQIGSNEESLKGGIGKETRAALICFRASVCLAPDGAA
jgi:hypothetical protein